MSGSLTILPDPPEPPAAVGLIAGAGRLPVIVAQGLKARGHRVVALALGGSVDAELPGLCDEIREAGLFRVATWGKMLARRGVRHAIMVGRVDKAHVMHDPWRMVRNLPDVRTAWVWCTHLRHDRRSYAVLAAIADELDRQGVSLMDSTVSIPGHMAQVGVMGRVQPTRAQLADITFSWPVLTELLRLDVGQSVAVRERDVLAVEAIEGTDRLIERVGQLCRAKGWTLCKAARAGHDRRSDVPTIGVRTIENLAENGGGCLALAAGDVIMIDRDQVIRRADELGVAVYGVPLSLGAVKRATGDEELAATRSGSGGSSLQSSAVMSSTVRASVGMGSGGTGSAGMGSKAVRG